MRTGWICVLLLAAVPTAEAASVSGALETAGALTLPAGARVAAFPLALYSDELAEAARVEGSVTEAKILVFEKRYLSAQVADLRPSVMTSESRPTWSIDSGTILVEGTGEGWLGIHAASGQFRETATTALTLERREAHAVGNGETIPTSGHPERPNYRVEVAGPSIARASDSFVFEGAGELKLMGPLLTITTSRNVTTLRTGEFADPSDPTTILRRWVSLSFEAGELASSGAPATVVAPVWTASWDGGLDVRDARGTLSSDWRAWSTGEGSATIDGAFSGTVSPSSEPDRLTLTLAGDLRQTTLASSVNVVPDRAFPLALALLVIGSIASAAGAIAYIRARQRARFDAEGLARLASEAADRGDFERAVELSMKARRLSPTSRRLLVDEAFFLAQAGDPAGALALLEMPLARNDPDALLLAARLRLERGELDAAARALTQALDVAPSVLFDVERDLAYAPLLRVPAVADALRRARRALG